MDCERAAEAPLVRRRAKARLLVVAAAILVFCFCGAASVVVAFAHRQTSELPAPFASLYDIEDEDERDIEARELDDLRRKLSISTGHGGCMVTYPSLALHRITPTWQASYPGSGARMTFYLIQALTGVFTNDDYDTHERGYEKVVAVKTHFPVKTSKGRFADLDQLFHRAIVILRNPINAIPSYFNLLYEHQNHLPNHSTRGPNRDWLEYRNHPGYGMEYQLSKFEEFVTYWMERYPPDNRILLASYEDLTDSFTGPIVATQIAHFLGREEGVEPIEDSAIPCVWETIVNYKNLQIAQLNRGTNTADEAAVIELVEGQGPSTIAGDENLVNIQRQNRRSLKGRTFADPNSQRMGPKVRPYTKQNLSNMHNLFRRLVRRYRHDENFVRIMEGYIKTVEEYIPTADEDVE